MSPVAAAGPAMLEPPPKEGPRPLPPSTRKWVRLQYSAAKSSFLEARASILSIFCHAHECPSNSFSCRRPLIYVYDLPPEFNAHLMQYRCACMCKAVQTMQVHMTAGSHAHVTIQMVFHRCLTCGMERT